MQGQNEEKTSVLQSIIDSTHTLSKESGDEQSLDGGFGSHEYDDPIYHNLNKRKANMRNRDLQIDLLEDQSITSLNLEDPAAFEKDNYVIAPKDENNLNIQYQTPIKLDLKQTKINRKISH